MSCRNKDISSFRCDKNKLCFFFIFFFVFVRCVGPMCLSRAILEVKQKRNGNQLDSTLWLVVARCKIWDRDRRWSSKVHNWRRRFLWVDCSELLERRFGFEAEFRLFLMREGGTFLRSVIEDPMFFFFSFRPTRATVLGESQD